MASDCLPYDLMVAKSTAHNSLSPEAVNLLISYIKHRKQRVKIGEHISEWTTLLKDIPKAQF